MELKLWGDFTGHPQREILGGISNYLASVCHCFHCYWTILLCFNSVFSISASLKTSTILQTVYPDLCCPLGWLGGGLIYPAYICVDTPTYDVISQKPHGMANHTHYCWYNRSPLNKGFELNNNNHTIASILDISMYPKAY